MSTVKPLTLWELKLFQEFWPETSLQQWGKKKPKPHSEWASTTGYPSPDLRACALVPEKLDYFWLICPYMFQVIMANRIYAPKSHCLEKASNLGYHCLPNRKSFLFATTGNSRNWENWMIQISEWQWRV